MAQEVTVTRKLSFNLSRYEQHEITVTVTGIPLDTSAHDISAELDRLCEGEVHRACLATVKHPDDNDTSVYEWDRIIKEGVDA